MTSKPHDRQKNYLLDGYHIPALIDMGVFSKDGHLLKPMQNKYKQINRYLEMINDTLEGVTHLNVVDFGCGKSYLTFVLYYFLTHVKGISTQMIGIDLKTDVIANCQSASQKYGYDASLKFIVGDVAQVPDQLFTDTFGETSATAPVMVVSLHACNTATDHCLHFAIKAKAHSVFVAPCCQHELKQQMTGDGVKILTRHGIVKDRVAALMTDTIRANLLSACGYKTNVMEFVELAHTPKNLLIRGIQTKMPHKDKQMYLQEVKALCEQFSLSPTLFNLLEGYLTHDKN